MNLSGREKQILDLLQQGRTNKEIGVALGISHNTVRDSISELARRFGVKGRAAAASHYSKKLLYQTLGTQVERRAGADRRNLPQPPSDLARGGGW